jgi:hypothetical protein
MCADSVCTFLFHPAADHFGPAVGADGRVGDLLERNIEEIAGGPGGLSSSGFH